ncbi:DoxX family protein [Nocardia neocaledoniensis]|uniref:DoxX family protein n=1 Tax=Nocardia neocaledoniensis TaxID=236511 RepID=UPI0033FD3380
MSTEVLARREPEVARHDLGPESVERWHPAVLVLFRFAFVTVGVGMAGAWLLHALLRTLGLPPETVAAVAEWTALGPLTDWIGVHVFDVRVDYAVTGSGDTAAKWVAVCSLIVVAVPVTAVWSVLDRRRPNYVRLFAWFRLLLRFTLVSALLLYGMIKVLPTQMSFNLERLVEPFGHMSPMAVLWAQSSLSEPYEIALGAAEVTAALLLILPLTAGLGAVLAVLVALQVVLVNLTFDVPVKLFALQVLLYAAILAAPHLVRIVRALLGHHVPAHTPALPVTTPRGRRILSVAQVLLGLWLLCATTVEAYDGWHTYGSARPKSPLYGIWNVTEYSVAGEPVPAVVDFRIPDDARLPSATERFRRIIFDIPQGMTAQRLDDSLVSFPARVDTERHTITLSKDTEHQWKIAVFDYVRPRPDQLILEGTLGGRAVRMRLDLVDLSGFPAVSRGFHWVQATPYYR